MMNLHLRVDQLLKLDPVRGATNGGSILQARTMIISLRNESRDGMRSMEEIVKIVLHVFAHSRFPDHNRHFCNLGSVLRG